MWWFGAAEAAGLLGLVMGGGKMRRDLEGRTHGQERLVRADTHPALAGALSEALPGLHLSLSGEQQSQLLGYLDALGRWNKVYNVTSIRDPHRMLVQHLLDSLAVIAPLRRELAGRLANASSPRLLDVGSGAGLPGAVIAIVMPEISVTCVDASARKAAFVTQAAGLLGLRNLKGWHARVESIRDCCFEVVTARAFSSLAQLVSLTEPLLAQGGCWMAMKGRRPDDELAALPPSVEVFHVEPLQVPGLDAERCLVWMGRRAGGRPPRS